MTSVSSLGSNASAASSHNSQPQQPRDPRDLRDPRDSRDPQLRDPRDIRGQAKSSSDIPTESNYAILQQQQQNQLRLHPHHYIQQGKIFWGVFLATFWLFLALELNRLFFQFFLREPRIF